MQCLLFLVVGIRLMSRYIEIVPLKLQASTIRELLKLGSVGTNNRMTGIYINMATEDVCKLDTIQHRLRKANVKFTHRVSKRNRHVLIFTNKKDLTYYYLITRSYAEK